MPLFFYTFIYNFTTYIMSLDPEFHRQLSIVLRETIAKFFALLVA